jgi:mannose-6-phosphate isomerase-like protein (cupin superfamily)
MLKIINSIDADHEKLKKTSFLENNELDKFDFSKVVVKKPWGHEYLFYTGNNISIWILYLKENQATSMHCHLNKTTFLIVLSGKAECSTLHEKHELNDGDGLIISKKCFHSTKALSKDGIILMEIENPSKKTDLVRLKDFYGRELKGYELQNEMCFDLSNYERVFLNENEINNNKKVGNMNLCIKHFNETSEFIHFLKIHKSSISFILNGEVFDEKNNKTYNSGEIFDFESNSIDNIKLHKPLKILNIFKNVLDFD